MYSLAGRLGLSLLVQRHCTNSALVNLGAFLIMTASMTVWGFWTSASGMCICSFWFGFAMSTMAPVHSEVILLVTNSNIYSFALGCSWVFMGLGWVLGAPVAGNNNILSHASEAGSPTNRLGSDKTRGRGSFGPHI